ncbi:MAG: hypothetical protein WCE52_11410, partial [Candidatus Acidiferrum sp.]
ATLVQLGPNANPCIRPTAAGACLIDNLLASGAKSGYTFVISGISSTGYTSTATPSAATTGTRQFCTDINLVIFYSPTRSGCAIGTKPL